MGQGNQLQALLEKENNRIANLANAAAFFNRYLTDINWVGFYLLTDGELILGPFQGLPACTRISLGKGVCGTAAKERKVLCVNDVSQFKDHIVCDATSQLELVFPLIKNGALIGVLDIDSPSLNRFGAADIEQISQWVDILVAQLN